MKKIINLSVFICLCLISTLTFAAKNNPITIYFKNTGHHTIYYQEELSTITGAQWKFAPYTSIRPGEEAVISAEPKNSYLPAAGTITYLGKAYSCSLAFEMYNTGKAESFSDGGNCEVISKTRDDSSIIVHVEADLCQH